MIRHSLFAVLGLAATASFAQPVVDQFQLDGDDQTRAVHAATSLAQSFTVGADGFLAGVELSLTGPATASTLRVKILDAAGGVLASIPYGEEHFRTADLADAPLNLDPSLLTATYVDLTGFAIAVSAGQELAISLETTAPATAAFATRISLDSDAYTGGSLFSAGSPTSGDMAFKTFTTQMELSEIVDQHQLNGFDQSRIITPALDAGQTLVAGATGLLEGVELILGGTGTSEPLLLEILDTTGGLADAPVLGQKMIDGGDVVGGFQALHRNALRATYVDLKSEAIVVVAGDQLGLRLSTDNPGPGQWSVRRAVQNLYSPGVFFIQGSPSSGDMAFKTFVSDPVFADDFETGDLSRWSETVP